MNVVKFGGSSLSNSKNIKKVLGLVNKIDDDTIIVVSAIGKTTDLITESGLLASKKNIYYKEIYKKIKSNHFNIIRNLSDINFQVKTLTTVQKLFLELESILDGLYNVGEYSKKINDKISSYGEILSSHIIFDIAKNLNFDVDYLDASKIIKVEKNTFNKIFIDYKSTKKNWEIFNKNNSFSKLIMPGFIASDQNNKITTLGRGGSDFSASIIANVTNSEKITLWTDVDGLYTANPKIVKQAIPISHLSYEEAMELSHFGAKVIYPPTIQPAMDKKIPIFIKNTFNDKSKGTKIGYNKNTINSIVKGISHIENIAILNLEGSGMVGEPGYLKRLYEILYHNHLNIIMVSQASSEHSICFGVSMNDSIEAEKLINQEFKNEIKNNIIKKLNVENNQCIVTLVGDKMKKHQGISGKMFSALGSNNINVKAITQGSSERNITVVIEKKDVKKALNILHERFFEKNIKQVNLFIIGVGNVGSSLIKQIKKQRIYLEKNLSVRLRVIALANSKKMIFNYKGINLSNWKSKLKIGTKSNINKFFKKILKLNYRNSIFIDNTASPEIAKEYGKYLKENIGVVTCNKIACSDELKEYMKLKQLSKKFDSPFLFETNVGAGLPIIDTLKNLIASGDKILSIEAILSGSLNYMFNNFNEENTFCKVVQNATNLGYTEPDPKIDLSGIDVARKILILCRESGIKLELNDIKNIQFLPKECFKAKDNEELFSLIEKNNNTFNNILKKAKSKQKKLKYIAEYKNGKAKVSLKEVDRNHNFYNIEGSDNIVLFYTNRYHNQPLIVKGAGAGAEVTASGIFADIIRISNYRYHH